jgi:hypothetical protein
LLSNERKKEGCSANNDNQLTFLLGSFNDATFTLTDEQENVIDMITQQNTASFVNLSAGTYKLYVTGDAVPCATAYQEFILEQEESVVIK